jgi:ubiquinone biosynthesis protein COQ9
MPTTPNAAPDWVDDAEQQVLDQALRLAPAEGFTWPMAYAAGAAAGLGRGETELLLPHGPADLAALMWRRCDARALGALGLTDPAALKIRARVRRALEAWLQAAGAEEAAARRLVGFLALPTHLVQGTRLAWESADALWRWAGDTATDENHYTKRAILAGILAPALAVRLSSGHGAAMAFVDRRIDQAMAFERWKAGVRPSDHLARVAGMLGRLRYR